jgi:hypothetical protein
MWSSFTITSPDAPVVVRERLSAALTPDAPGWRPAWLPWPWAGPTTFDGEVRGDEFRITRNLARTERTLPITATGRLIPAGGGTTVEVTTRPQWWVLLVLCAWSVFWARMLWLRLVSAPLPDGIHRGEIVVLVGFLAFGWGLLFITIAIEEWLYKQELTRILVPAEPGAAPHQTT